MTRFEGVEEPGLVTLGERLLQLIANLQMSSSWSLAEVGCDEDDFQLLQRWAAGLTAARVHRYLHQVEFVQKELSKDVFGLLLLLLFSECARRHSAQMRGIWDAIRRHCGIQGDAVPAIFVQGQPRPEIRQVISDAAKRYRLRHVFDDVGQIYYLTITLQYGFSHNGFVRELASWLRGYPPEAIQILLGRTGAMASRSFSQLWEALRLVARRRMDKTEFVRRARNSPWVLNAWVDELFDCCNKANVVSTGEDDTNALLSIGPVQWGWPAGAPAPRATISLAEVCNSSRLFEGERYAVKIDGTITAYLVYVGGNFIVEPLSAADSVNGDRQSLVVPLRSSLEIAIVGATESGGDAASDPFERPFEVQLWPTLGTIHVIDLNRQAVQSAQDPVVSTRRYLVIAPKLAVANGYRSIARHDPPRSRSSMFLFDGFQSEDGLQLNGQPFWIPVRADAAVPQRGINSIHLNVFLQEPQRAGSDFRLRLVAPDGWHVAQVWSAEEVAITPVSEPVKRNGTSVYDVTQRQWVEPGRTSLVAYLSDGNGRLVPQHLLVDVCASRDLQFEGCFLQTRGGGWRSLRLPTDINLRDLQTGRIRIVSYRSDANGVWPNRAKLREDVSRAIGTWERVRTARGFAANGQLLQLQYDGTVREWAQPLKLGNLVDGDEVYPHAAPEFDVTTRVVRVNCCDGSAVEPTADHRLVVWTNDDRIWALPADRWLAEEPDGQVRSGWSTRLPDGPTGLWAVAFAWRGRRLGVCWEREHKLDGLWTVATIPPLAAEADLANGEPVNTQPTLRVVAEPEPPEVRAVRRIRWLRWFRLPIDHWLFRDEVAGLLQTYATAVIPALLSRDVPLRTEAIVDPTATAPVDAYDCYLREEDDPWLYSIGEAFFSQWQPPTIAAAEMIIRSLVMGEEGSREELDLAAFHRLTELSPSLAGHTLKLLAPGGRFDHLLHAVARESVLAPAVRDSMLPLARARRQLLAQLGDDDGAWAHRCCSAVVSLLE